MLAVWTGSRGALIPVGCNDDIGWVGELWDPDSQLTLRVEAGTSYFVEASTFAGKIDPDAAGDCDGCGSKLGSGMETAYWGGLLQFHLQFDPYPIPSAPVLAGPTNGLITSATTPVFAWNAAAYGITYQLQIDDSATFSSPEHDVTGGPGVLEQTLPPLADGVYSWRVRAFSDLSIPGPWSTVRSLTIDTLAPAPPTLMSPAYGASVRGTPTYSWSASAGATRYEYRPRRARQTSLTRHTPQRSRPDHHVPPSRRWAHIPGMSAVEMRPGTGVDGACHA
jgi:hypothetical protein